MLFNFNFNFCHIFHSICWNMTALALCSLLFNFFVILFIDIDKLCFDFSKSGKKTIVQVSFHMTPNKVEA